MMAEPGVTDLNRDEQELLKGALEDWVGLWRFVRKVRDRQPEASVDDVRQLTMGMVRKLVGQGYVRVGDVGTPAPGFWPWPEDEQGAFARIEREWQALGRDPNLWEICWFAITPEGEAMASSLVVATHSSK
jgi:hypothetical protein